MKTALLLTTVALLGAVTSTDLKEADEISRHVQARFDATKDFTARVEQELMVASAGRTLKAQGTVAFKRPGKMRWVLHNDESQIIVADGTTLWFYQPEEKQVLRTPFESAFRSTAPISFLTGVGRIHDNFEVSLEGRENGRIQLGLLPRKDQGELGRLSLTVDAESYDIVGAEVRDPLGNVTRLRFSELNRNAGLPDSLFRFEIPPGVDVIDAPIGN